MKKLILVIGVIAISLTATNELSSGFGSDYDKYCAKLKEGKIVLVMQDKSEMNANIKLENGTVVKTDGTVVKADGSQITLKDGECIDRDGNVMDKKGKMQDEKPKKDY